MTEMRARKKKRAKQRVLRVPLLERSFEREREDERKSLRDCATSLSLSLKCLSLGAVGFLS